MYQASMSGKPAPGSLRKLPDIGWRESFALMLLVVPAFWIGLYPKPVLRLLEPQAQVIVQKQSEMAHAVELDGAKFAQRTATPLAD